MTSFAVHPGAIATDIYRSVPSPIPPLALRRMVSPELGARGPLGLATAAQVDAPNGAYFARSEPREPSPLARDTKLAREFWERSAGWVGFAPNR